MKLSSNNIRTTYAYDAAGRLEYETVTREAGGTTNLSRTQYAYAYIEAGSGGGRSLTRTETTWGGSSWDNDNKVLYEWNALEWMRYEQRHDWVSSAWSAVYDVSQEYDKNGNRTRYHKNVQGLTAEYGIACDLSYTYDGRNFLSLITDADTAGYQCAVTCDLNNNITEVAERMSGQGGTPENNFLYTYFEYDDLNRLLVHKTKQYVTPHNRWLWTKREHGYDAVGRAAASAYTQWPDGSPEPGGTFLEHTYYGDHLIQNTDGSSNYGAVWYWAGIRDQQNQQAPLKSPNPDTTSQSGYNQPNNVTPQRRTYLNPTTEGDERNEWGQGRPQAKDASGAGTNWATGTLSQPQNGNMNVVESRLMFEGTVTTDLDRATDAREQGRVGIFGSALSYAGAFGRVTSESIGRDLNSLGRGDGEATLGGAINLGRLIPILPGSMGEVSAGNSVNSTRIPVFGGGGIPGGGAPGSGNPCDLDPINAGECCPGVILRWNKQVYECRVNRFDNIDVGNMVASAMSSVPSVTAHGCPNYSEETPRIAKEHCYGSCEKLLGLSYPEYASYIPGCKECCDEHIETMEEMFAICCGPDPCNDVPPPVPPGGPGPMTPADDGGGGGEKGGRRAARGCCGKSSGSVGYQVTSHPPTSGRGGMFDSIPGTVFLERSIYFSVGPLPVFFQVQIPPPQNVSQNAHNRCCALPNTACDRMNLVSQRTNSPNCPFNQPSPYIHCMACIDHGLGATHCQRQKALCDLACSVRYRILDPRWHRCTSCCVDEFNLCWSNFKKSQCQITPQFVNPQYSWGDICIP